MIILCRVHYNLLVLYTGFWWSMCIVYRGIFKQLLPSYWWLPLIKTLYGLVRKIHKSSPNINNCPNCRTIHHPLPALPVPDNPSFFGEQIRLANPFLKLTKWDFFFASNHWTPFVNAESGVWLGESESYRFYSSVWQQCSGEVVRNNSTLYWMEICSVTRGTLVFHSLRIECNNSFEWNLWVKWSNHCKLHSKCYSIPWLCSDELLLLFSSFFPGWRWEYWEVVILLLSSKVLCLDCCWALLGENLVFEDTSFSLS